MDQRELEAIVQRLVANPHDQEALSYAHQAGAADPKAYAVLLEKVGAETQDPAYASHWLAEAAKVWNVALGDAHRAARVLMTAIDKDPTQEAAADQLAQLYREKGEHKSLAALLERRAKALVPLMQQTPDMRPHVAAMYEELGRLWSEAPLATPRKALEHFRRAIEIDPRSVYAIYGARQLYKEARQWADAIPLFDMEQSIVDDPERKVALYRDESGVRKEAGDIAGATQVLRIARGVLPQDPGLMGELAGLVLERIKANEPVPEAECVEAADLCIQLAEMYGGSEGGGEHALAYAFVALDILPGHDRGIQLAGYFGKGMGQADALPARWRAYLAANPSGFMAQEVHAELSTVGEPTSEPASGAAAVSPASAPRELSRDAIKQPRMGSKPESIRPSRPPREEIMDALDDLRSADAVAVNPEKVARLLQQASESASKGNKADAFIKYKDVLALDAANSEALTWAKDHMRQKRLYQELREALVAAARASSAVDDKRQLLREVAALCEQQLRDADGAITALRQIVALDRTDSQASESLRRLLERASRWDELASILEDEAMNAPDLEDKVQLSKKLAQLHEGKRKDFVGAADAWTRIAALTPEDDQAIWTAVKLYERGDKPDLAALFLQDTVGGVDDAVAKANLYVKLGELREKIAEHVAAGDAYGEAAQLTENPRTWELAEKAYLAGEAWGDAARALDARAELTGDPRAQSLLYAKSAELYGRAGDDTMRASRLEQASDLDPANDEYAAELEKVYSASDRQVELAELYLKRADNIPDRGKRVALRKQAAAVQRERLDNMDAARETLTRVLEDSDDEDALRLLSEDAENRDQHQEAVTLLKRLGAVTKMDSVRLDARVREARLLEGRLDDIDGAIARYESILNDIDPKHRDTLVAIAELEERRENAKGAAAALERILILTEGEQRIDLARKLADLYENSLDDERSAIRALEIVTASEEEEDFEAIARLCNLAERVSDWPKTAALLRRQIEVEGDEEEIENLTLRLSTVLDEKLSLGDEALAALESPADDGSEACRAAYVALGDKLGWRGLVANKLVAWNEVRSPSEARNAALRSAFERLVEVKHDEAAIRVGIELVRSKAGDAALARTMEEVSLRAKDLDGLQTAHDLLARELSGADRAAELVRQAETLIPAGVDTADAIQHGEGALASVAFGDVEPLLARLAVLAPDAGQAIDVYERHVSRLKQPAERVQALARAAGVAAQHGATDRARGFFELALAGGAHEETLSALEAAARKAAEGSGSKEMVEILATSLSMGGQGSRDGGRTRSSLLRRAAQLAHRDLADTERAFGWLGDALVAHVDAASLDAVTALGDEIQDVPRVEAVLTRALGEVFDGPLVRQLLARRAQLRKDRLNDKVGAAADLKKLHDLAPTDQTVMEELTQLLTELGDYRGMVQVLEDQILRGKDPSLRAELARRVAVLWEERLADAREAADAWRRVLRMKAGDADAQAGLERAKSNNLRQVEGWTPPAPVEPAAASSTASSSSSPRPDRVSAPPASVRPPPASIRPAGPSAGSQPSGGLRPSAAPSPRASTPPALPSTPPTAPGRASAAPPPGGTPSLLGVPHPQAAVSSGKPISSSSEGFGASRPSTPAELVPLPPMAPVTAPAVLPEDPSAATLEASPGDVDGSHLPPTVPPPPMAGSPFLPDLRGNGQQPFFPPDPRGAFVPSFSVVTEETVAAAVSPEMLEALRRGDSHRDPFTNEERTPVHAALPSQPAPAATARPVSPWDLPRLRDEAAEADAKKTHAAPVDFAAGDEEEIGDLDEDIEAVDDEELIESFDDETSPGKP